MEPKLSIIVPVYNVEKYLPKCLDSTLEQSIQELQILVIDDGSTDNSGAICDAYAQKDSRIQVFHKENGGLSSARNFGIEKATGEYIGFVDSDDYIDADMYATLMALMQKYDAEMSMCGLYDIFDGKPRKVFQGTEEFAVNSEEAIKIVLEAKIVSVTAVNKLYKRSLFDTIRYPVGKTAEDAFVILKLLDCCKTIAITTQQKYYYIHRSDSITTNAFSEKTLHAIEAYEENFKFVEEKYPALIETAKMRLCWANFYVLDRLVLARSDQYDQVKQSIRQFLRDNTGFILRNENFTCFRKLSAVALWISIKLYKACVLLQNQRYRIK